MKTQLTTLVLLFSCALWLPSVAFAQTSYEIQPEGASSMRILGTSTFHDWEMETKICFGDAVFVFSPGSEPSLEDIKALTFELLVEDLKSSTNGLDKNAYKALQSDKYPDIKYKLSSVTIESQAAGYLASTRGQLTIAGTTKEILMDVFLTVNADKSITCKGSYTLQMTEYGVTPPSFMLGVMKTGDDITLNFLVTYEKSTGGA